MTVGRNRYTQVLRRAVLTALVIFLLLPVAWMVSSSLKPDDQLFATPIRWIPAELTLAHYDKVFTSGWFTTYLANSVFVASAATAVSIVLCTLGGYALSRYSFRARTGIMIGLLGSQVVPVALLVVPLFVLYSRLELLDSKAGLTVAFLAVVVPFCMWLMKAYFDSVPIELEEAAQCDGCSRLGALLKIVLPATAPGLISVGLFSFLVGWNEYLITSVLIQTDDARTLSVGIVYRFIGAFQNDWGALMAMGVVMSAPIVLGILILQRYFVEGLTSGAVKG